MQNHRRRAFAPLHARAVGEDGVREARDRRGHGLHRGAEGQPAADRADPGRASRRLELDQELAATKDDFASSAASAGEARGVPEAKTATQANIVNVRAELRESRARNQVAAGSATSPA
jgi:hypothetical protein